ncbi:endonuclease/exonuclease/phosphatase family protein [Nocardia terpenica]|uniref:Endonuclease/exonuclease/phosphatase domain-containing protein n=1 Tax=Nocardia terpenica TaxID=455432 RepID=A0A161XFN0_9NOCA|nr:endonuclease/exonuclease/phosphatase family protein [Nocardia terpenica]KZM72228.1 hypothetical protein AWN90_36745 [Nocardia terpenica]NQE86628.1 endonuclease [Nocardia terpenica]
MTISSESEIRLMTLNVQRASEVRAHHQVAWLSEYAADVVVLTEVSAGRAGDVTARLLEEAGYSVHLSKPGDDNYRVLLAARGVVEPIEAAITVMPNRFVFAGIKPSTGSCFSVAGLYVPSRGPKEARNVAKRAFQEAVAATLPQLAEQVEVGPCVITGDLNVVEPGHTPHYKVFGTWEYDFYRSFAANGFTDAFRLRHPDLVDHSWFGRPAKNGSRNGYRFDHTFISTEHRDLVSDCYYEHQPRLDGISDHAAMILTLRM